MHTRAAVAVFDVEASNKIVTCKVTSDRSMSRPLRTAEYWYEGFMSVNDGSIVPERATTPRPACREHDGLRRDSPAQAASTKVEAPQRNASVK
jgi:hypothetical protein